MPHDSGLAVANETILIIEDDPTMRRALSDNFQFEGFDVITAADGEKGLEAALNKRPDLVILDLMLPKVHGYEICRLVRQQGLDTPIIMLTAKGQESDIVLGLNLGADDYVTKPFSVKELLARSNAFLRRRRGESERVLQFGPFELDLRSHSLSRDGEQIELAPKEFALLAMMAQRPGRAITRDDILRHVWGHNVFVTTRSVDRCVNTLRKKIEQDPTRPRFITTVRQIGYRFEEGPESGV